MDDITAQLERLKTCGDRIRRLTEAMNEARENHRQIEYQIRRMMFDLNEMERNAKSP